ncbi:glycosyltransferase family 39 protein [Fulvivirga ligni]|uniref:glycosyltransferase family 39 protein n=1 Tax=Fulvivirga ligni TaxID=2904246 RepID=UPI001F16BE32|nr:glycosyltransferase family 39 protein [Fulvivirga ligni]UII19313.1 glycosyltransferase family 39 protein [Fulvivirga ligni]
MAPLKNFKQEPNIKIIHLSILSILYLALAFFLFHQLGVKYVNDTHRYLDYATRLKSGFQIDEHNIWYISYVFFIYLLRAISGSDNYLVIILAQYFLGCLACLSLYQTAYRIFNNRWAGFTAALLYISFYEVMSWHSYLLCESLYVSLVCFSLFFLSHTVHRRSIISGCLTTVFIILTCFAKPTGIALVAAVVAVLIYQLWIKEKRKYVKWPLAILGAGIVLYAANTMLYTFNFIGDYETGEIIYAIGTVPYQEEFKYLMITVPSHLNLPEDNWPPLFQMVYFIVANLWYFLKLFFIKAFYFLAHFRPYWSWKHNIYAVGFLGAIYFFTFRAFSYQLPKKVMIFCCVYVLVHIMSVGFTTVDWDGRFLMPVLPVLFILASQPLIAFISRSLLRDKSEML